MSRRKPWLGLLALMLPLAAITFALGLVLSSVGQAAEPAASAVLDPEVAQWAFISAALAAGISALAGGYAVASVGSAALGTLAEKPELTGRVLIFVGLAEGIAIYGLIVAILILNRLG
jgi:V/A-type H+-transporting ATPase subunit K